MRERNKHTPANDAEFYANIVLGALAQELPELEADIRRDRRKQRKRGYSDILEDVWIDYSFADLNMPRDLEPAVAKLLADEGFEIRFCGDCADEHFIARWWLYKDGELLDEDFDR